MQRMKPKRNRENQELFQKKIERKRDFLCCQKKIVNEVKKKKRRYAVAFCRGQEYERANCDDER